MILLCQIAALLLVGGPQEPAATVRRISTTVQLAAQEYALGVSGGRVVATAEVEEARLFLSEAMRNAGQLPSSAAAEVRQQVQALLDLVEHTASPDTVSARVQAMVVALSGRFAVTLEEIPEEMPSLARGAAIYQASCARCHGDLGRGDGKDGQALEPRPANLAQADALADRSPLDFYRRTTIGVAGTAMPSFEQALNPAERWAVAAYASILRLPAPAGDIPPALRAFATTAKMSDAQLLEALGAGASLAQVALVRAAQAPGTKASSGAGPVFSEVRRQVDSAFALAKAGRSEEARQVAFDAYLTFEQVERGIRARAPALATEAEDAFAALRNGAGAVGEPELAGIRRDLDVALEKAERVVGDRLSPLNLFIQSFIILLREGLEAILLVGALMAFLVRTGASGRRRDIHIGVAAAIVASLLTAVALETAFRLTPARQELIEGVTLAVATVMLFYVSYWLLSKFETAKWNRFVKEKVQDAVTGGSALALASVAFLAVYREGFETVLFYKALMVSGGSGSVLPVLGGVAGGGVILAVVYVAINRFGMRLPLKPFFAVTSAFLYYMAFVFAGKAVAELQESAVLGTTIIGWAPRVPPLGIYPTVESLSAQAVLVALALVGLGWLFLVDPARRRRASADAVPVAAPLPDKEMIRSLDRIDADLAEARAELERIKERLGAGRSL